jgi:hypothetical protein
LKDCFEEISKIWISEGSMIRHFDNAQCTASLTTGMLSPYILLVDFSASAASSDFAEIRHLFTDHNSVIFFVGFRRNLALVECYYFGSILVGFRRNLTSIYKPQFGNFSLSDFDEIWHW